MKWISAAFNFVRTYFALLVVLAVFVWSAFVIVTYRAEQTPPDAVVIRLGHWQLEAGVRDGLNQLADEYRKLHPDLDIRIIQDAIPETASGSPPS